MFGFDHERRREQREQRQREYHADAEEDGHRLVAAIAGLHEAQTKRAQLLGRARRLLADALDEAHQPVHARLGLVVLVANASARQLFEPAIDGDRPIRHQRERRGRRQ